MPDTTHHISDEEVSTGDDLGRLTARLASLDLDPATLEILMAALTIDVSDEVDSAANA
ncbi:MAG: hypothetical protein LC792_23010 [Actinobacteria bacterium]|nr:hypothetical protein [Actinomycetota bacterium]